MPVDEEPTLHAWSLAARCWRDEGVDWAQTEALWRMCGVTPTIDLMDGVLAIETGAREHFRRQRELADKRDGR